MPGLQNGRLVVAFAAGFGGMSPKLLQLAVDLTGNTIRIGDRFGFTLGVLLFGVLGAATAVFWGERRPQRAYVLGLGLPGLIVAASAPPRGTGTDALKSPPPIHEAGPAQVSQGAFPLFAAPAYAQTAGEPDRRDSDPAWSGREVVLTGPAAESTGTVRYARDRHLSLRLEDVPEGTELVFGSTTPGWEDRRPLSFTDDGSLKVPVPDDATYAVLRNGTSTSKPIPLTNKQGTTSSFKVDVDTPFWKSLLQALGARNAAVFEFEVKPLKPSSPSENRQHRPFGG